MRRFPLTATFALGLLELSACLGQARGIREGGGAGDVHSRAVVDRDYRFRLELPGPSWQLLDKNEASKLNTDAVAAAMSSNGLFAVIIVEHAPGVDLEAYATLLLDQMSLEEKVVEKQGKISYKGMPAYRFVVTGRFKEIPFRYINTVFLHQDHAYQVFAWGMQPRARDESSFAPLHRAFSILEGTVTARAETTETKDAVGVGWRIQNGVYESAITGLRVRPGKGWRLVVQSELSMMNDNAEVALAWGDSRGFVLLVAERVRGVDKREFAAKIKRDLRATLGIDKPSGARRARFLGKKVAFDYYGAVLRPQFDYIHAVLYEGDLCLQILGWSLARLAPEVLPHLLGPGIAAFERMSAAELRALSRGLDAAADPRDTIGQNYSLRGGVYRDFAHQLVWRPPRGFWRILVGPQARAHNADAVLYFENRQKSIHGLILPEAAHEHTGESFHRAVLSNFGSGFERGPSEPFLFGSHPGRVSEVQRIEDGIAYSFVVGTVVHNNTAVQILAWALPGVMKKEREHAVAAIAALRFDDQLRPVEQVGNKYIDYRMGFSLRLPSEGWRLKKHEVPGAENVADWSSWEKKDRHIGLLAMNFLLEGQDDSWFVDRIEQLIRGRFPTAAQPESRRDWAELGGFAARHIYWMSPVNRMDIFIVVRGGTVYALTVLAPGSGEAAAEAKANFRFLD